MSIQTTRMRTLLASNALALLVACGGGGGDGGTGATYTVGGQLSGLLAGQSVTVQNNGADALTLRANGSFTFAQTVPVNGAYAVTVSTQPAGQRCSVANGTGRATANIGNVAVSCEALAPNTFTVGGTASGLGAGKTVVLQNNGGDDLTVSVNGGFTFATALAANASYAVTIRTQPAGQTCALAQGTGTANANVSSVRLSCQDNAAGAVQPVYLIDTYRVSRADLLAQADAQGANGFAYLSGMVFGQTTFNNIYVKDIATTYRWEALDLPATAAALQAQFNAQGARGFAFRNVLTDGQVNSVYYIQDALANQALAPYSYELLPSPMATSSAFLAQANDQGARGFAFLGEFMIGGAPVAIYGKDSSAARYTYAVQASASNMAPAAFVTQANTQGQQGYVFIGEYVFTGNPANEAFKSLYMKDTTQAVTVDYQALSPTNSSGDFLAQANAQGQAGYYHAGAMVFFPNGTSQPSEIRNLYAKVANCSGSVMCRGFGGGL